MVVSILRLAGGLLLAIGGWFAGDLRRQRLAERCRCLEAILWLLARLEQEIDYRHRDLNRLYRDLQAEAAQGPLGESLRPGGSFQTAEAPAWLEPEEQSCFLACMSGLGRTAAEQECVRLAYYQKRFGDFLKDAAACRDAASLDRKLGLAAGGMLALWLL